MIKNRKIIISGGDGGLAKEVIRANKFFDILAPSKSLLNIIDRENLSQYLEENMAQILADVGIPMEEKTQLLHLTARGVV